MSHLNTVMARRLEFFVFFAVLLQLHVFRVTARLVQNVETRILADYAAETVDNEALLRI